MWFQLPYPYFSICTLPPSLLFSLYFILPPFLPEYQTSRAKVGRHKGDEWSCKDLRSVLSCKGPQYILQSLALLSLLSYVPTTHCIPPFPHLKCCLHHHLSPPGLSQSKLISLRNTTHPTMPTFSVLPIVYLSSINCFSLIIKVIYTHSIRF